jgi:hypothetical protein
MYNDWIDDFHVLRMRQKYDTLPSVWMYRWRLGQTISAKRVENAHTAWSDSAIQEKHHSMYQSRKASYLRGSSSSSLKLGLGPSTADVLAVLRWNITSTYGWTWVWKQIGDKGLQLCIRCMIKSYNFVSDLWWRPTTLPLHYLLHTIQKAPPAITKVNGNNK